MATSSTRQWRMSSPGWIGAESPVLLERVPVGQLIFTVNALPGRATVVTDSQLTARYQALPLVAWAQGPRNQFVTVAADLAEGR